MELEGALEQQALAHEQATDLERHGQPLVRIERDRVGPGEIGQGRSTALGQDREGAVGAIDVEPDATLVAHIGQGADRVHRAGVGAAGIRTDEERQAIGGDVGIDTRPRRHAV